VQSITRSHAESRSILWPSITRPLRLGPCPGGPPADWLVCACARHGGRRRRTAAAGPGGHQPAAGVARAALPRPATGLRCCTRQQRRRMCVDSRSGHACPAQMLRADRKCKRGHTFWVTSIASPLAREWTASATLPSPLVPPSPSDSVRVTSIAPSALHPVRQASVILHLASALAAAVAASGLARRRSSLSSSQGYSRI
jgi:hypothetical protein